MKHRISPHLREQMKNEAILRKQAAERAGYVCERCHTRGDFRGLSLSHNTPKGMGGTHHVYTLDEVEWLCYPCHNLTKHGIKEILPS